MPIRMATAVEVSEITRGGSTVRTARFLANRVLAHPKIRVMWNMRVDEVLGEVGPQTRGVQRMLERDDFTKRVQSGTPIYAASSGFET